nr:unnamed protein product [Callosobruchus chinensis]
MQLLWFQSNSSKFQYILFEEPCSKGLVVRKNVYVPGCNFRRLPNICFRSFAFLLKDATL